MTEFILAIGMIPVTVTKLTDMIRNAVDPEATRPKVWWNVVPFVLGAAYALIWQVDYHTLIPGLPPLVAAFEGVRGQIITGLGIGAVASGWHEVLDFFSSKATQATKSVGV